MTQSCEQPGLMPLAEASRLIQNQITPVTETESCALHSACGRVLSAAIYAEQAQPSQATSAMDGYAVRLSDLDSGRTLTLVGKSFAGHAFTQSIQPGECVRIMTGALLPQGADTVVMQENAQVLNQQVEVLTMPKLGDAVRQPGEFVKSGQVLLAAGHEISPADVGLLASIGIESVSVLRRAKVAVFSTGDELVQPGHTLDAGQVYDSNRPALVAMLQQMACDVIDMGQVDDDPDAIERAFLQADSQADMVITSGGVSVGEADFTKDILQKLGQVEFWKLAIKPGKPLAFGRLPNSYFFGLPGNPVSALVTFHQIAREAIQQLKGRLPSTQLQFKAIAAETFRKRPGRLDFQRAIASFEDNGDLIVRPVGNQGSGILLSISMANCFAVIPADKGTVAAGEKVDIQMFDELLKR